MRIKFLLLLVLPSTLAFFGRADPWTFPCEDSSYSDLPFCDTTLDVPSRAADYVSRIPIDEKLGRNDANTPLSNSASAMPSVGVGNYQWWSEALHGVASSPGVSFDVITSATSFPQVIATSMSFNRTLFAAVGDVISTEARAFANSNQSGYTFWTPNLNIFRDPRWGRGQETPGEDPYLTSEYVRVYVPGLQGGDVGSYGNLKVSACCKHYLGYSLEAWDGVDRHHFNAIINPQDMADTYLPAFEACASPDQGAASAMMCSYNSVNGVPSCANYKYLTEVARNQWEFEGYITSDCGAVEDVYTTHHYASDPIEAVVEVLEAGTDSDCGGWFDSHLEDAFDSGALNETTIDAALTRLAMTQLRLGLFNQRIDASNDWTLLGPEDVGTDENNQLALDAARQAVTLLKNDGSFPLDSSTNIALIGPNANATDTMQGNYNGVAPFLISPLMGLSDRFAEVSYAHGCDINSTDQSEFTEAVDLVSGAGAVVLVMGLDQSCESEGNDRYSLALPGQQENLIAEVLDAAQGKPVALVIMAGGAVCLGPYADDDRVSAIYFVGYPGQSGGQALAEVLDGEMNPSGRLTQTFYKAPFVDEISMFEMGMRSNDTLPGRTYRFYSGDNVVYPFGTGLSYTSFSYYLTTYFASKEPSSLSSTFQNDITDDDDGTILATVNVLVGNTGDRDGTITILIYLVPPTSVDGFETNELPLRSLRAFSKVSIAAGGATSIAFPMTKDDFSLPNSSGEMVLVTGEWKAFVHDSEIPTIINIS